MRVQFAEEQCCLSLVSALSGLCVELSRKRVICLCSISELKAISSFVSLCEFPSGHLEHSLSSSLFHQASHTNGTGIQFSLSFENLSFQDVF